MLDQKLFDELLVALERHEEKDRLMEKQPVPTVSARHHGRAEAFGEAVRLLRLAQAKAEGRWFGPIK